MDEATAGRGGGRHAGDAAPSSRGGETERRERLREHHAGFLWAYWLLLLLGLWMLAAPLALGHLDAAQWVRPSGSRGVWFGAGTQDALRARLLTASDLLSGLLLLVFGWRSLRPDRPVSVWICCSVGVWLSLAPIVLWAPTAAAYLNDTLVGMLAVALSVLIPGMPNMLLYMKMGGATPPGWSYNPSSWPQRAVMIGLAFLGFLASRQLAAFQLGYTKEIWDPFFGAQTRDVLNSSMSHSLPVSDGALGTFAYTFEFLMGWMGSPARWRTMPWMVTFFGVLVIPLGLVHIFLVVSQPVTVGAWCTLCLLAAAIMLPMLPLQIDEVVAMGQHVAAAHGRGESLWSVFWKGGSAEGSTEDERTPEIGSLPEQPLAVAAASVWGMSVPWTLLLSATLGVALLAAPALLAVEGSGSDALHLGGALATVVAVVAMGEPARALRWLNVPIGLGLAASPWVADGFPGGAGFATLAAGLLVAGLAPPRGVVRERYGGWERWMV